MELHHLVRTVYMTHSFLPKHFYLEMVLFAVFFLGLKGKNKFFQNNARSFQ